MFCNLRKIAENDTPDWKPNQKTWEEVFDPNPLFYTTTTTTHVRSYTILLSTHANENCIFNKSLLVPK